MNVSHLWKATGRRCAAGALLLLAAAGVQVAVPTSGQAAAGTTTLQPGQNLLSGQSLVDGNFKVVLGTDGNLVIDEKVPALNKTYPIWATGTPGHPKAHLSMATNGNLVLYDSANRAYWSTNTSGHASAYAYLGTDGGIYVQNGKGLYWQSYTAGNPNGTDKLFAGQYLLDGLQNLQASYFLSADRTNQAYLYGGQLELGQMCFGGCPSSFYWRSGSSATPPDLLLMQSDSNLVIYQGTPSALGQAKWASNSRGSGANVGAYLKMQNDGNLVIYSNWGRALWATDSKYK